MKSIPTIFPICFMVCAAIGCAPPPNERIPQTRKERQMIGLLEKFDRWDYNGDGRLTFDELDEASKISGIPARDILSFYDTNKDGGITLREAQSAYQRSIDERS